MSMFFYLETQLCDVQCSCLVYSAM